MDTNSITKSSYPHQVDHDEILDFIKKYSYRGMVAEVAHELVELKGGQFDSAKQLISKVKAGKSMNTQALQLLVQKAKMQHNVIKNIKKDIAA